jgi:hypothetical protein
VGIRFSCGSLESEIAIVVLLAWFGFYGLVACRKELAEFFVLKKVEDRGDVLPIVIRPPP